MRKLFFSVAAAAIAFSPLSAPVAKANLESGPTYENLTETSSFYRVTRGFVSPLLELDNDVNTKIEFTLGRYLTYMDYIFVDDLYVNSIKFTSNDATNYQRVVLMENGMIRQQYDLYKYPDGVIPVNFASQKIDTVKVQFNGTEGKHHTLAEIEIIGNKASTASGSSSPSGSTLVTPATIAELTADDTSTNTGAEGGEPVATEPVVEEDNTSGSDSSTGEPVVSEEPPAVDDGSSVGSGSEGTVLPPATPEEGSSGSGSGSGDGTLVDEPTEESSDGIGGGDFVDNGEVPAEEAPAPVEEEAVAPVENAPVEGSGDAVAPEAPVEDGSVVSPEAPVAPEAPVEEPVEEQPVSPEAPVEEQPEEEASPAPVEEAVDFCSAHPLTPSVFKSKQNYAVYSINSASLKLLSYYGYNDAYVLNKLSGSKVVVNNKAYSAEEFIGLLKIAKFSKVKSVNASKQDCQNKGQNKLDKDVKPVKEDLKESDYKAAAKSKYLAPSKEDSKKEKK